MTRLGRPLCLSLAVLLFGPAVGSAVAQQPACGQVVTHDVRLTQDLRCPETNGVVVGAHGITIDLNGHMIHQGVGFRGGGVAVDNSGGYDGVTVRNGSVGADGDGVRLVGASGNRLVDLSAAGGTEAVSIEGGSADRIVRGSFTGFAGIRVSGSDSVRITDVRVQSAPADGISLSGSWGVIARNTVPARIGVAGNGNRVTDNVIAGALDAGIAIVSGSGNVVARNWAVDTEPVFAGDDSTGDGIHVGAFTAATVVRHNIAVRNGDDGIDLDSSSARVAFNLANDNGDLGIDARPGTSAAGNIAHGNGNPAQCAGIICG
jgi:parallel beta-helix repeat protein